MRVLDRYILRELALPLIFCSVALIFFFLIADLFNHLDGIISNQTSLGDLLLYYLNLVPFAFTQTISWATLFAATFLFVRFNTQNEFIAMKASGLHITQIVFPIVFMGFILGVLTFSVGDQLMPSTFLRAEQIRKEKIEGKLDVTSAIENVTLLDGNVRYYARKLDLKTSTLSDIVIHIDSPESIMTVRAPKARWTGSKWRFYNVSTFETDMKGNSLGQHKNYPAKVFREINASPGRLEESTRDIELLNLKEIQHHISQLKDNNIKTLEEEVEFARKLAFPWHSLIVLIILAPFLIRTYNRRQMATTVLICLGLVIGFHIIGLFSLALGRIGVLPTLLSAWLPFVLFLAFSILIFEYGNQ